MGDTIQSSQDWGAAQDVELPVLKLGKSWWTGMSCPPYCWLLAHDGGFPLTQKLVIPDTGFHSLPCSLGLDTGSNAGQWNQRKSAGKLLGRWTKRNSLSYCLWMSLGEDKMSGAVAAILWLQAGKPKDKVHMLIGRKMEGIWVLEDIIAHCTNPAATFFLTSRKIILLEPLLVKNFVSGSSKHPHG